MREFKLFAAVLLISMLVTGHGARANMMSENGYPNTCKGIAQEVPKRTLGRVDSWYLVRGNKSSIYVDTAADREWHCCKRGDITRWSIAQTNQFGWVGSLAAWCSDNEELPEIRAGKNGTQPCRDDSAEAVAVDNPLDGSYTVKSGFALEGFLAPSNQSSLVSQSFSCPAGTVAIGYSARSQCLALVDLKVLCGVSRTIAPAPEPNRVLPTSKIIHQFHQSHHSVRFIAMWMTLALVITNIVFILFAVAIYSYAKNRREAKAPYSKLESVDSEVPASSKYPRICLCGKIAELLLGYHEEKRPVSPAASPKGWEVIDRSPLQPAPEA